MNDLKYCFPGHFTKQANFRSVLVKLVIYGDKPTMVSLPEDNRSFLLVYQKQATLRVKALQQKNALSDANTLLFVCCCLVLFIIFYHLVLLLFPSLTW